jgi:hypothetical protein
MRGRVSADTGLISAVLAGGDALCLECITQKTGVPISAVESVLERIAKTLRIERGRSLCRNCLTRRTVFRFV